MSEIINIRQQALLILSNRPWNSGIADRLARRMGQRVETLSCPEQVTTDAISEINPKWIFVPHWSHLIPKSIWGSWPTVIFHMTDLPYGRGGSPLQNLIQQGHVTTMITALHCGEGLDAGDVYLKEPLDLHGSAEEIFLRADALIETMIERIVLEQPKATPQEAICAVQTSQPFREHLSLCKEGSLTDWYDQIRMLDATGYPHAFLEEYMRLELRLQRSEDSMQM